MFVPATPTTTPTLAAVPALAPLATAFAGVPELRRRYDSASASAMASCYARVAALSCAAPYVSCLASVGSAYYATGSDFDVAAVTSEQASLTSCYCAFGAPYLSCYLDALTASGCGQFYESYDYTSYASVWYSDYCGTVPATLFADAGPTTVDQKQIPTSVSLDFESVTTTTLTSTPPPPSYTYAPLFASTASLLHGACASTRFNLLEDVGTVYWAAYAGCGHDMPQCCPWTASAQQSVSTATTRTATTTSTTATGAVAAANNVFPSPANSHDATLRRCPADYTPVAGRCCPSSYWPFTRALGGQTPCYSSLAATTVPPTLTVGLAGQPTATQKPTSAVVNVVWAMSYPHKSSSSGGGGRIAGIVIGSLVAALLLADIAVYAFVQWRHGRLSARSVAVGWVQPRPWWPSRGGKEEQEQPQQPQQPQQKQEPQEPGPFPQQPFPEQSPLQHQLPAPQQQPPHYAPAT